MTIRGSYFGSRQGSSTVTFGERRNVLGFAPCSKKARVISWSRSSITVRVPGLAPGSHKVYVTVGGRASKSYPFSIAPLTTISNRTFATSSASGNVLSSGHDLLYENCTFTATSPHISGTYYGVVMLGGGHTFRRVTFLNCTFTGNTGVGSGVDYGVNGIKVNNWDSEYVSDISFVGCKFGQFSRMGYEQVNSTARYGAQRVAFQGCTFEPCGGEQVSLNGGDLYNLVVGCTLKGSGNLNGSYNGWNLPQYWGSFEINTGRYVEVRSTAFWAGNGPALNLSGVGDTNRHLLFNKVDIDFSHSYQAVPTPYNARVFHFQHVSHVRFKDCAINTGSRANCVYNAGWADPAADPTMANWYSATHNDFRGSTITGYIFRDSPHRPSTGRGYWDAEASQTNIWPTAVR